MPQRRRLLRLIFGYDSGRYTGIFHMRHPTLLTPRDFDLSPYFEIIKFNVIVDGNFDYTRIQWAKAEPERPEEVPVAAGDREEEEQEPTGT